MATLAAAMIAGSAVAMAQPLVRPARGYRLTFHALDDATCPPEAAFRDDVADLCGQDEDAFDADGQHEIRVIIRKNRLYEASVELIRADGTLEPATPVVYQAATCGRVTREVAVAASALIPVVAPGAAPVCDEECVRRREEAAREQGRKEGREQAEREARERGRIEGRNEREREIGEEIEDAIRRRWRKLGLPPEGCPDDPPPMTYPFAVTAGGVISLGYALNVAPGFVVGAEWRPADLFSLELDARALLPTLAQIYRDPNDPAGDRLNYVATYSGLLVPCFRWKIAMACGVVELGATRLEGPGEDNAVTWFRFALGPRVGLDVPFAERFSVRVLADLLISPVSQVVESTSEGGRDYEEPYFSGFVTAAFSVGF